MGSPRRYHVPRRDVERHLEVAYSRVGRLQTKRDAHTPDAQEVGIEAIRRDPAKGAVDQP
jgi:hypothetical protein